MGPLSEIEFGVLRAHVDTLREEVRDLKVEAKALRAEIASLVNLLSEVRGGWKLIISTRFILAGLWSLITGAVTWAVAYLQFRQP